MPSGHMAWLEKYNILKEYYDNNGSINYLTSGVVGRENLKWLVSQRKVYKSPIKTDFIKKHIVLLNKLFFDWSPRDTEVLNSSITFENKSNYNSILTNRVNHILDDLTYEGINEIDANNQEDIEKIMIKRIWR